MSTEFNDDLIPERIEDDPVLAWMTARVFAPPPYSPGAARLMQAMEDEWVKMLRAEIRERAERPVRKLQERIRRWEESQAVQGQGDTPDADAKRSAKNDKAKRACRKG
jgi:hypothetical protein